jgi:hypothetical protein
VIINLIHYIFIELKSSIINLATYLDFIFPLVSSQSRVDALYSDPICEFGLVSQPVLLRTICAYGHCSGYINQIRGFLNNRKNSVRALDTSANSAPPFNTSGY